MVERFDTSSNVWKQEPNGAYRVHSDYIGLKTCHAPVPWYNMVWHKHRIPQCAFIAWLGLHGRLLTKDGLLKMGMNCPSECELCQNENESHEHLFFHWNFMVIVLG